MEDISTATPRFPDIVVIQLNVLYVKMITKIIPL